MIGDRRRTKHNPIKPRSLLALILATLAASVGQLAITTRPAAAEITGIRITAQSHFVAPNGSFVVEITVDGTPTNTASLELAVTVFNRIVTESEVDDPPSRAANRLEPVALNTLTRTEQGRYRLEIPIRSGDPIDELPRLHLPDAGVYPVTIELRNPDGVVAASRTNLIRLPPNAAEDPDPLRLATVLPVVPAEGFTVADAQKLLTTHPDLPVTVLLGDGVISQLQDDPALTAGFAEALGDRPLVATPNVNLDPSALAAIGRAELYHQALDDTYEQLKGLGLQPTTTITIVGEQLTVEGAAALMDFGIELVIDASTSPAPNGYLAVGDESLPLVRYDEPISGVFGKPALGVNQANQALARLVVRGQSNRSPVVIGGSALGPRPTQGLNVLFHALARGGAPQPVPLAEAATSSFERRPAERAGQDLEPVADLIADNEALLASYGGMYAGGGVTPDDYLIRLQSALAPSRNPQDRHRSLILFADEVGRELEVISLPDAQPVTMAARQGSIPLIVESRAAGPRLIMLQFRSDKVEVKQDSQLLVVEPGTSSIDVEVQARTLGSSQLEVSIWTPDGNRVLARSQFQIRSTAVPGLGLLIAAAAVAFLIVWWWLDHRRSRARRVAAKAADILGQTPSTPVPDRGLPDRGLPQPSPALTPAIHTQAGPPAAHSADAESHPAGSQG